MTRPSPSSARGFTLVELLIGAALSAAIMAAVLSSYIYLGRGLARLANQQVLEGEARRTLAYFTQDVQAATAIVGSPTSSRLALTVPAPGGTNTVTYYFNSTSSDATPTISGSTVTVPATTLVRCVHDGSTLATVVLLRYITDNDTATTADLAFRYFDASGTAYDSGSDPFTTSTSYLGGIKQVSLQFATQLGNSTNGTQTAVQRVASSRVIMRNKSLLP